MRHASLFGLPATLLALACGSGGGSTSTASASGDPGGAAPTFAAKTLELDGTKIEALVPQGWTEKISTGSFAEARYTGSDFRTAYTIGTTCNGSCEPDKWLANTQQQATEQLAFYNDPKANIPAADVEVKQNAETEPGHFVLFVKTQPKDPKSGGRSRLLAKVWRYAPDWKTIVTCAVEAGGDDDAIVDAAIRACHALKLTPG